MMVLNKEGAKTKKKLKFGKQGSNLKPDFIVVVDDDPLTNFLNRKLLIHFGANAVIETFEDPYAALNSIAELNEYWSEINEICILLDLQMMEMDGIEFLKRLKIIRSNIKVRVYIVSGSMPVIHLEELKKFSLAGFFLKPLTKGNVREVLMPLDPVYLI